MTKKSYDSFFKNCAGCREVGVGLRFFPLYINVHPLKEVCEGYGRTIDSLWGSSLPDWPGKPSLTSFKQMMDGEEPVPPVLENLIWRYFHYRFGQWWFLIGHYSGQMGVWYVTTDGRRLVEDQRD